MTFGEDFFKIIQLVIGIMRLFGRIFGDKEDRKHDDEAQENHQHEINVILNSKKKSDKPTN